MPSDMVNNMFGRINYHFSPGVRNKNLFDTLINMLKFNSMI